MLEQFMGFFAVIGMSLTLGTLLTAASKKRAKKLLAQHTRKRNASSLPPTPLEVCIQDPDIPQIRRSQLGEAIETLLKAPGRRISGQFIDAQLCCEQQTLKLQSLHCDQLFPLEVSLFLPPRQWQRHSELHTRCAQTLRSRHQLTLLGRHLKTTLTSYQQLQRSMTRLHCMLELAAHQAQCPKALHEHMLSFVLRDTTLENRRLQFDYLCLLLSASERLTSPIEGNSPFSGLLAHVQSHGSFESWLAVASYLSAKRMDIEQFVSKTTRPGFAVAWHYAKRIDTYRTLTTNRLSTAPIQLVSRFVGLLQLIPKHDLQRINGMWELLEGLLPLARHASYLRRSIQALLDKLSHPSEERQRRMSGVLSIAPIDVPEGALSLGRSNTEGSMSLCVESGTK